MKKLTACLVFLLIAITTYAETELPNYKIAIARFKKYYNNNQPDSLFNSFAPSVKNGLPLDKTKELFNQMQAQLGPLKQTTFVKYIQTAGVYKAEYQKETLLVNLSLSKTDQIDGLYFNEYKPEAAVPEKPKAPVVVAPKPASEPAAPLDPSLTETPITLPTLGGTLSATLTVPKDAPGKMSLVLIVPGVDPVDRNGNNPQLGINANTYKYLAEALGKSGIATLRYDKRGFGKSTTSGKEDDTKFTDNVDDASALLLLMKDDKRFSRFVLLGHNEGALISMITAYSEPVNAFISVEGTSVAADHILMDQVKLKPPAVSDELKTIIDSLKKGKLTSRVDPALYFIARPSRQGFLMTWLPYDPVRVIKKVKITMMIVQGTTDLLTTTADAEKLKKAKPDAVLKEIDGMNRVLKLAPADRDKNMATYMDPDLPIASAFVTAVVDFVKGLK